VKGLPPFKKAIGRQNASAHQIPSWPKYQESFELIRALEIFVRKLKTNMATWGTGHLPKNHHKLLFVVKNHLPDII